MAEKLIYAIALLQNDSSEVAFICRTLVQEYIQPQVSYQVADGRNAFNRDILKAWIFLIGSIKITYTLLERWLDLRSSILTEIKFCPIVFETLLREVEQMSPRHRKYLHTWIFGWLFDVVVESLQIG